MEDHAEGFSTAVGLLSDGTLLGEMTEEWLLGLADEERRVRWNWASGVEFSGVVERVQTDEAGQLRVITFTANAGQSAASGLQPYSAESGISSVRAGATAFYPLTRNWRLTGVLQYRELVGDAGDSPLVLQDGQWFGGAFVGYRF